MSSLKWQQLLTKIRPFIGEDVATNKASIISLLTQYTSREADFERYVNFDDSGYTKNLVEDFGEKCNIIVMCWAPGQKSLFHGHEGSKCFVKVLSGRLKEQQVTHPKDIPSKSFDVSSAASKYLETNQVTYIDDSIGLHKVTNESVDEAAITLHIYMPAYRKCRVFEANSDQDKLSLEKSKAVDVTFYNVKI